MTSRDKAIIAVLRALAKSIEETLGLLQETAEHFARLDAETDSRLQVIEQRLGIEETVS
jgi:hypothetical protein